MIRYIKIYKALIKINLVMLLTYRANFINSILNSAVWGVFSIFSILILTSRTGNSLFGWTRYELVLLSACYAIAIGIFHTFLSRNFERISRILLYGQFDSSLMKPLDSQFSLSLTIINFAGLIRVGIGVSLFAYLIGSGNFHVTLLSILFFIVLLMVGIVVLYSVWFIVTTLLIWIPELSNIIDLMYSVTGMARYPPQMYRSISSIIFFMLLPLVFIFAAPFKALIGDPSFADIITLTLFGVVLFILSRWFWKFALKSYTSASN